MGRALRVNVYVPALPRGSGMVFWDAVVGSRVVSLYLVPLLSSGDDYVTSVVPNVDDVVEIAVVVVVVVALLFLAMIDYTLASQSSLLVANSATLV